MKDLMNTVNLAAPVDSANRMLEESTFEFFPSGIKIYPAEDFSVIKYPFWHGSVNPFLHDFEAYAKFISKKAGTVKDLIPTLTKGGACEFNLTNPTIIKFEIVPGCVFEYNVKETTGSNWITFLRENKEKIVQYLKKGCTLEGYGEDDFDYLDRFKGCEDAVGMVGYEIKYKIRTVCHYIEKPVYEVDQSVVDEYVNKWLEDVHYVHTSNGLEA